MARARGAWMQGGEGEKGSMKRLLLPERGERFTRKEEEET